MDKYNRLSNVSSVAERVTEVLNIVAEGTSVELLVAEVHMKYPAKQAGYHFEFRTERIDLDDVRKLEHLLIERGLSSESYCYSDVVGGEFEIAREVSTTNASRVKVTYRNGEVAYFDIDDFHVLNIDICDDAE